MITGLSGKYPFPTCSLGVFHAKPLYGLCLKRQGNDVGREHISQIVLKFEIHQVEKTLSS